MAIIPTFELKLRSLISLRFFDNQDSLPVVRLDDAVRNRERKMLSNPSQDEIGNALSSCYSKLTTDKTVSIPEPITAAHLAYSNDPFDPDTVFHIFGEVADSLLANETVGIPPEQSEKPNNSSPGKELSSKTKRCIVARVGATLLSGILAVYLPASEIENKGQLPERVSPEKSEPHQPLEKAPSTFIFVKDKPCPSNSEGQRNLHLSDVPKEMLPYLKKYNIPVEEAGFCQFLENLRALHNTKIEEGFIDMAGDYLITSQNAETAMYLTHKYAYPTNGLDIEKLKKVSTMEKMVEDFLAAIDRDPDADRKKTLNDFIYSIASKEKVGRRAAATQMVNLIFDKSWLYQPFTPALMKENADIESSYVFKDRGLRTTADIRLGLSFHDFIHSEEGRRILPRKIQKVLIIGPGLEFINVLLGNVSPEQIFEPFGIMDCLINAGKSEVSNLQVDAFDINERVINHLKRAIQSGKPYQLYKIVPQPYLEKDLEFAKYFSSYGGSLPGVGYRNPPRQWKSLSPGGVAVHLISIPADIVGKIRPILGDITTTSLEENQYDLIVSFNTFLYLDEKECVLAGINLQRALKEEGVFITDIRFESDTGRRVGQPASRPSQPLFDDSFIKLSTQKKVRGKEVFIYQRGSK